jgi:hypothetical protein
MKPLLLSRGCSGFNPFCWVLVFTARPIAHVVPSIKMSCKKKEEKGKEKKSWIESHFLSAQRPS